MKPSEPTNNLDDHEDDPGSDDLVFHRVLDELDLIRHASPPSPPMPCIDDDDREAFWGNWDKKTVG